MILCEEKANVKVEYAFRNCTTPIGVATYQVEVTPDVPQELAGSLPTQNQIDIALQASGGLKRSPENPREMGAEH